eukprot:66118_1
MASDHIKLNKCDEHTKEPNESQSECIIEIQMQTPDTCNDPILPSTTFYPPKNSGLTHLMDSLRTGLQNNQLMSEFRLFERVSDDDPTALKLLTPPLKFENRKYKILMEPGRYPTSDELFLFVNYNKYITNPENFEYIKFINIRTKDLVYGFTRQFTKKSSLIIQNMCLTFYYPEPFEISSNIIINRNKTGQDLKINLMKQFEIDIKNSDKYLCTRSFTNEAECFIRSWDKLNDIENGLKIQFVDAIDMIQGAMIMVNEQFYWENALNSLVNISGDGRYLTTYVLTQLSENISKWDTNIQLKTLSNLKYGMHLSPTEGVPIFVSMLKTLLEQSTNYDIWIECLNLLATFSKHKLQNLDDESILMHYESNDIICSIFKIIHQMIEKKDKNIKEIPSVFLRQIIAVIGHCAVQSEKRIERILENGFAELATMFFGHQDPKVREDIMWAISMILTGTHAQIHVILEDEKLLSIMMDAIKTDVLDVKIEGVWAICHSMHATCPTQLNYVADAGGIEAFCSLLNDNDVIHNDELLESIIEIIDAMLEVTRNSPVTKYFECFVENNGLDYLRNLSLISESIELKEMIIAFKTKYWDKDGKLIQDLDDPNSCWARFRERNDIKEQKEDKPETQ